MADAADAPAAAAPTAISPRSPRRARSRAARAQAQAAARRTLPGTHRRHRRRHGRGRHAAGRGARAPGRRGNRLRRRRRQGPEEPVRLASRSTSSSGPMQTVGVVNRHRGPQGHRDRRAVRRGRGDRAVHQPDVDGHLQDPDRHQGALRDRPQPASRRRSAASAAPPRSWPTRRARPARPPERSSWMTTVTLEGTQELMRQREVAVILATGGMGLVRAAYSAGKPAYGVGPGNAPALHRAVGRRRARPCATSSPARRSTTACSARRRTRSWSTRRVADDSPAGVRRQRAATSCRPARDRRAGAGARHAAAAAEPGARRQAGDLHRRRRPASPCRRARGCSSRRSRASGATIRSRSRSSARSCPFTSSKDWREGCERCKQILRYGGMGHTMSIHSRNEQVILEFGLQEAGLPHRA